jgi:glycosyltransferase involved in cell wall biosynthesis
MNVHASSHPEAGADASAGGPLLLVAATDYDSSRAKGVEALLHDFDERGFFDKVVMAFPFTRHSRVVPLGSGLSIHEYSGWGPPLLRQLLSPLHIVRVGMSVARLARRERAALVRATDPCFAGLVGLIAARLARKPFCVSLHADFDKRDEIDPARGATRIFGSRRLAVAIECFVMSRADLVMPIRESLVAYCLRRGADPARIRVIPHGADLSPFVEPQPDQALTALDLPAGRPIISFVGRISRENYIDDVLAAARIIAQRTDDPLVVIAGGGVEDERVRSTVAADPVLANAIRVVGFQPRPVIAALRQASAVALCPMGGFSLIEACAAGAPVVAYDVEWHRELVIADETGYLVAERSATGLADAVSRLLDNREVARDMGLRGRALAVSRHSLDRAIEIKRQAYRAVIAGAARE